jgi:hypothetical protein
MSNRCFRSGAWFLLLAVVCGCGGSGPVRVTGTVTSKGEGVPNLVVHFTPAEGRPSWGFTDEKGGYKLKIDNQTEGALRGEHKVYVEFRPHNPKEESDYQTGKLTLPAALKAALAKYGNPQTSTLRFQVTQDNQVIDIPLD